MTALNPRQPTALLDVHPVAPSQGGLTSPASSDARGARTAIKRTVLQLLRNVLALVGASATAFGLGYGAGKLLHDPRAVALAHASGACIAMEMAAAHGAVDELERRMTLRALASALNPHFERFPERASDITDVCDKLTKSAVSGSVARRR